MTPEQRKTPGRGTGGISEFTATAIGNSDTPSLADPATRGEVLAQMLNGIYIVVAQINHPILNPVTAAAFYAGLASAQLAVDRARMNGKNAHLFIGQVTIIGGDPR